MIGIMWIVTIECKSSGYWLGLSSSTLEKAKAIDSDDHIWLVFSQITDSFFSLKKTISVYALSMYFVSHDMYYGGPISPACLWFSTTTPFLAFPCVCVYIYIYIYINSWPQFSETNVHRAINKNSS